MLAIIIWPRGNVTARDLHPGDARVGKHDAEEGQAVGMRRGRDEAAEEQIAVGIEVFDQRGGACPAWGVYVCEDRAEAPHRCWGTYGTRGLLVPGIKNKPSVMLLPTGVNNRDGLKVLKMVLYVALPKSAATPME